MTGPIIKMIKQQKRLICKARTRYQREAWMNRKIYIRPDWKKSYQKARRKRAQSRRFKQVFNLYATSNFL